MRKQNRRLHILMMTNQRKTVPLAGVVYVRPSREWLTVEVLRCCNTSYMVHSVLMQVYE